jgi:hypothetical protein
LVWQDERIAIQRVEYEMNGVDEWRCLLIFAAVMGGAMSVIDWLHLVLLADESLNNNQVVRIRLGSRLRRRWIKTSVNTLYTYIDTKSIDLFIHRSTHDRRKP